ncbi:MAG: copper resistance protein B [Sphingomonadales bacterium]
MKQLLIVALLSFAANPTQAQTHADHGGTPGADPQTEQSASTPGKKQKPASAVRASDPHSEHSDEAPNPMHEGHKTQPPASTMDPHAGHGAAPIPPSQGSTARSGAPPISHEGHNAVPAANPHAGHGPSGTEMGAGAQQPVGSIPPPPVILDNAADKYFGVGAMQRARDILGSEHGGTRISKVFFNIAEYQSAPSGGGYRWDGEAWFGGDINRVVLKSEGEGSGGDGLEAAEAQVLYSRAVTRYMDLQVGVRHDFAPGPERTYATVGFETLLPFWLEVEGALFLSDKGDLIARVEGFYDFKVTQRLILQPQAELRFSAQDIPELNVGSGLTHMELGLRLRYEIRREFAPYVGVAFERAIGETSKLLRAAGEPAHSTTFVAGIRFWF